MKIYTVTFSNTLNVGAELQMFALYRYLKNRGTEVKVINYQPPASTQRIISWNKKNGFKNFLKSLIINYYKKKAILRYINFDKDYIEKTSLCKSLADVEKLPEADMYITGSDQVWNLEFDIDDTYFLRGNLKGKKISYAASMGMDNPSKEKIVKLLDKTNHLDAISVREKTLQNVFENNGIINTHHVLDPVFLLEKQDYINMQIKPKYSKYVFVYCTARDSEVIKIARMLADKHGLKVIEMNRIKKNKGVNVSISHVDPREFLGYINNAEFVVTNSFHCTAFSIVLNKQFFVKKLDKYNSRIDSLLTLVKLNDTRALADVNDKNINNYIDFNEVNRLLERERQNSRMFLDDQIIEEDWKNIKI